MADSDPDRDKDDDIPAEEEEETKTPAIREVPLYKGKKIVAYAKVDAADYEKVMAKKWYLSPGGYAYTDNFVNMHLFVWQSTLESGKEIDHRDRDKLNNTRNNLRLVSRSLNGHNKNKRRGTTSKYRGVSFRRDIGKWWMAFRAGEYQVQRYYDMEREAAIAYNEEATRVLGDKATLNIIVDGDDDEERELSTPASKKQKRIEGLVDPNASIVRNEEGVAIIPLSNKGRIEYVLVDDECWHEWSSHNWCVANKCAYNSTLGYMHRLVLRLQDPKIPVVHINGDRYDNRRVNLLVADNGRAMINRHAMRRPHSTLYVGVIVYRKGFRAVIRVSGKKVLLGDYNDVRIAAWAYNCAFREQHGPDAPVPNQIVPDSSWQWDSARKRVIVVIENP